ncbi:hypothetical protein C2S52_022166 [Perilla frutescens var. hirtella]|nr:hypothetical protein C2S52_022166 [Perilla frutescens var. hirtella]
MFYLGGRFRFCPEHYALVSGLNFGYSSFVPTEESYDLSTLGVYKRVANETLSVDDNEKCDDYLKISLGAYTYGALIHYVGITSMMTSEVMPEYHLYCPMRALQVWAYETIPALGEAATNRSFQNNIPYVLSWKFGVPSSIDFESIFGQEFLYREMMVSAHEAEQEYWISTHRGEIFGVCFLIMENPLHPRQIRDGRSILFRKAMRGRRSKNASVRIE